MLDALSSAIQGLKAVSTRTHIASHNLANLNTDNFKRKIPFQVDNPAGVSVEVHEDPSPGFPLDAIPESNLPAREMSNVSMERELVELMRSKHSLIANIKAIETALDNEGTILDIKA